MNFSVFKAAVTARFARMSNQPLFRTDTDRDVIAQLYLSSFPPGTNPIFRKRTEHDCSCCRKFIRDIGNVVTIDPTTLELTSIWDIDPIPAPDDGYNAVAKAMSDYVKSLPITEPFLHSDRTVGTPVSRELLPETNTLQTFEHFHVSLPPATHIPKPRLATRLGELRTSAQVLQRALSEFTTSSLDTVLELIAQNTLYRGPEHKANLQEFRALLAPYHALPAALQPRFVHLKALSLRPSVTHIRNTSIGTLLTDLSADMDLDQAVRRYESVVAPANYKRPTALVTPKMIEAARSTLQSLGLLNSLSRRYATLQDISIPDTLFVDRNVRPKLADASTDVFDTLAAQASKPKPNLMQPGVVTLGIDDFVTNVLPTTTSLELFFENRLQPNLVSLIAPQDPTAPNLMTWGNPFSWSYNGDVTDSIKERVKKAGGSVEGDLCCRLAWWNNDDLDFHMREVVYHNNHEIFYGNLRRHSPNGGMLDVDMNGADGLAPDRLPVENIFYKSLRTMKPGTYELFVHQFSQRETKDVGFEVEIDLLGTTHRLAYPQAVKRKATIPVATFEVSQDRTVTLTTHLPSTTQSRTVWNLPTEQLHPVTIVLTSPNHWDANPQPVGNKHFFFMLDGCQNDAPDGARGFYNEFLKPDLNPHRKVLEMVGSKMRTQTSPDALQLSGLGFSSTLRNYALVKVTGAFTRTMKVEF